MKPRALRPELIMLTILAVVTRTWQLFQPPQTVFDEVYFKAFAGDYLSGSYYFDIHPPLGKLLLAGWAKLAHYSAATVANTPAVQIRVLPALAGAAIIPVFYLLLRQLGASRKIATLGGIFLLADNALTVESRFILVDSMLLLFELSAITLWLAARRRHGAAGWALAATSALLAGAAVSVKWTGLGALGLIGLIAAYDLIRRHNWRRALAQGGLLILLPAFVYLATFWVHFQLLPKSGAGDAFMTTKFQSTLIGNANYDPSARMSFWAKTIELNHEMYAADASLKNATHPYGSKWNSWPIEQRDVYYWEGQADSKGAQGNIYLLGNPIVWWGTVVGLGVLVASFGLAGNQWRRWRRAWPPLAFLLVAYLINWLPFIAIVRVMFLYHYLLALCFSIGLVVYGIGILAGWQRDPNAPPYRFGRGWSAWLYGGIIVAIVAGFAYFAPLTYGTPLTPRGLLQHMWLKSWR